MLGLVRDRFFEPPLAGTGGTSSSSSSTSATSSLRPRPASLDSSDLRLWRPEWCLRCFLDFGMATKLLMLRSETATDQLDEISWEEEVPNIRLLTTTTMSMDGKDYQKHTSLKECYC